MAIHLGRPSPNASRDRPERRRGRPARRRPPLHKPAPPAAPTWSCSRWGLPCRCRCRPRGALLPHHFTLAAHAVPRGRPTRQAVPSTTGLGGVFLWHFPWGRPRRALPGTAPPWSPDFPPSPGREADRRAAIRPSGMGRYGMRRPPTQTSGRSPSQPADTAEAGHRESTSPASPNRPHAWLGPDPCGDSAHGSPPSVLDWVAAPGWSGRRRKADGV